MCSDIHEGKLVQCIIHRWMQSYHPSSEKRAQSVRTFFYFGRFYRIHQKALPPFKFPTTVNTLAVQLMPGFSASGADMENVPSKPSAAWVIFLARVNFWYEHTRLLSRMAKILSSMLYQAVGG